MARSPRSRSHREQLVQWVQELEHLEAEKQAAAEALRDAFSSAKAAGFDPGTLKVVLRLRKMTPEERKEKRALEAIYLAALGMLEGDPLPDEARRRLDEDEKPPAPPAPADAPKPDQPGDEKPTNGKPPSMPARPAPPPQPSLPLKDPEEARAEGRAAAAAGKRIYDNPFPAGDPCRAAWDEGWCEKNKSHGMDTPSAYQRRPKPPEKPDKPDKPDDDAGGAQKGAPA